MSRSRRPGSKRGGGPASAPLPPESKTRRSHALTTAGISRLGGLARIGRKRPVLRAVIIFCVLLGLFYGFVHTPRTESDIFQPYLGLIATTVGGIVGAFGYDVSIVDTSIRSSAYSMEIIRGCDGIEPTAAFLAAVVASPVSLWTKVPGILLGTLVLLTVNLLRLVSLFFIGVYFPSAVDVMHEDIWQAAFIALAIVLWGFWVQWATRDKWRRPDAPG